MKKKIVGSLLLAATLTYANEYKLVAENFLKYKGVSKTIVDTKELKSVSGDIVGYVYSLDEMGYIIVPYSKNASPIKSYSLEGKFENMPPNFEKYLIDELTALKAQSSMNKIIDDTVQKRWDLLENFDSETKKIFNKENPTPLLTTTWNQPYPYNKILPKIGDTNVLTGCVQTADGQVMKYHSWPQTGQEYAYNTQLTNSVTDLSAVFNRYYNWDLMPDNLDNAKEYEIDEVAYLMKDLVVANQAMFEGTSGTGAYPNPEPLVRYFKYSSDIKVMSNQETGNSTFFNTIKDQYSKQLPVLFSVPGHRVVVDGYDDDLVGSFAHINMGWGGSANAYYNLSETINAGGYSFAPNYSMFYDVKPCNSEVGDCYKNYENSNEQFVNPKFTGVFDSIQDVDTFKVKLKGSIEVSGYRDGFGSSSMYFFVGIFDENGKLLHNLNKTTTINFPEGNYEIRSSLSSFANGSYWQMQSGVNGYNVELKNVYLGEISDATEVEYLPVIDQQIGTQIINSETEHKMVIYGYDKNDDDILEFVAVANNGNITPTMVNNVLTLIPNVTKGHSKVKITLSSNGDSVEKEFDVIISDEDVAFGKEYTINGMFESQSDYNEHKALLSGTCTISGKTLGYSNQAFYTKLEDVNGMTLNTMKNISINTSNLTAGNYTIGASLQQNPGGYGSYYPYGDTTKNYQLTVSCPNADTSVEAISEYLDIVIDDSGYEVDTNSLPAISIPSSITLEQDKTKTINYGVSDADGDNVEVSISTNATNGNASVDTSNNTITYVPTAGYYGSDSFVVSFDDGKGEAVEKTITVTINEPINVAPKVSIETLHEITEDSSVQIPYTTYDQNGDTVTVSIKTQPLNGTITQDTNSIIYTPNQSYYGDDSFVISLSDGKENGVVEKTIYITVLEKDNNLPEVTMATSMYLDQDSSAKIDYTVSDADGDSVSVNILQVPNYGAAIVDDGFISYIPQESFYGSDLFIVSFSDGQGGIVDKTVNVSVNPVVVNSQPIVEIPNSITVDENISSTIFYSIYDKDGDNVVVTLDTNASNGTVLINEQSGSIQYTPNDNFVGSDSFTMSFDDKQSSVVMKTVGVIVNKSDNNLPTVYRFVNYHEVDQDTNTTLEPKPVVIDDDGDTVTVTVQSKPTNGTVSITTGEDETIQIIVYSPNQGYYGEDYFTVEFDDQNGGKVVKEININVTQGTTSYLSLNTGWNLVSLPVDNNITNLSEVFTKSSTLWKYNSLGWEAFGGTQSMKNSLKEAGIIELTELSKNIGFWANNYGSSTVALKGDSYNILYDEVLTQAASGWHLLGTGKDITVNELLKSNPNLNTVWVYDNGWKAYSPLDGMTKSLESAGIDILQTINKGKGFWINVK